VPLGKVFASALRVGSTVVLVSAFGFMAYACYRKYLDTGSVNMLGLVVINTISMSMFMARRDATSVSSSPVLWLIAFAGTLAPTLMRPTTPALLTTMGNTLQLAGILCTVAALLSLRRSLGIVPANRGIRTQGLYNVVRHPLYASELLAFGGFAIANPSLWNLCIWLADCGLQYTRACAEERFLSSDPSYLQYRSRVKYRLIPLII
jgi:protein-S-isoprenylcysteine O-methyltransferase Ste14